MGFLPDKLFTIDRDLYYSVGSCARDAQECSNEFFDVKAALCPDSCKDVLLAVSPLSFTVAAASGAESRATAKTGELFIGKRTGTFPLNTIFETRRVVL
jgi:hypothetical protein